MSKKKIHHFLDNNSYYTAVLSILALITGAESILEFSYNKLFIPAWFDNLVFILFILDFIGRFLVFFAYKYEERKTKYSSLFSIPFTIIDMVALVPDVAGLFLGTGQMDLKAIRAIRAFKLLRVTRLFTKNKLVLHAVLNFFRYKLYGQGLVFGANLSVLVVFGGVFSFVHYEYSIYEGLSTSLRESLNWGLEIFTDPYGNSYKSANGLLLKATAFLGSTIGLFVYASIVGVLSNTYKGIFDIIDKGVGMTSIKKGDFVILGWNHLIPNLVEHITSVNNQRAVVLGSFEKGEIRNRFDSSHASHVYNNPKFEYMNIDYTNAEELKKLNIWQSEKIVIVYDEGIAMSAGDNSSAGNARDARILFTMKTIKNIFRTIKSETVLPKILCEVFCKSNKDLFREDEDVEIISKESLFSNVFSQSVVQDDILNVYKRLLKTDDKELYIVPFQSEAGVIATSPEDYYEQQSSFSRDGIGLVGLYFKREDGGKAGVIISPSEKELKEAHQKYSNSEYDPNYILLAESPEEVAKFQKDQSKKAA